ncbi:hypothetical protein LUZ63_003593 [Rhynchospora breviuscula]|uniref:Uncharacterized protein n=1 Tax=Rhynchospora breviuscula TaxID=2022672 RepID=A0A9Q0HYV9_9POAL|nr:hypothetical protein LUZ63_003593 [Rhynchospora breviuscula]
MTSSNDLEWEGTLTHQLHLMQLLRVLLTVLYWLVLEQRADNRISLQVREKRDITRQELLGQLLYGNRTCEIIRMGPLAFLDLCKKLVIEGGLKPTRNASIEE